MRCNGFWDRSTDGRVLRAPEMYIHTVSGFSGGHWIGDTGYSSGDVRCSGFWDSSTNGQVLGAPDMNAAVCCGEPEAVIAPSDAHQHGGLS